MIKKTFIAAITVYQAIFSTLMKNLLGVSKFCRFDETCSQFVKRSISEYGVIKGSGLGIVRLLKCQPFFSIK